MQCVHLVVVLRYAGEVNMAIFEISSCFICVCVRINESIA